jgi:tryptophan-rich sensory protein
MQKNRPHWMVNPSKKQVVLICIVWFIGILLTAISVTNIFTEHPFQSKNFLLIILQLGATLTCFGILRNYLKQSRK